MLSSHRGGGRRCWAGTVSGRSSQLLCLSGGTALRHVLCCLSEALSRTAPQLPVALSCSWMYTPLIFFPFFLTFNFFKSSPEDIFFHCFLEREKEERETSMAASLTLPDQDSNPQTFGYGTTLQTTEPHMPGPLPHFSILLLTLPGIPS